MEIGLDLPAVLIRGADASSCPLTVWSECLLLLTRVILCPPVREPMFILREKRYPYLFQSAMSSGYRTRQPYIKQIPFI